MNGYPPESHWETTLVKKLTEYALPAEDTTKLLNTYCNATRPTEIPSKQP